MGSSGSKTFGAQFRSYRERCFTKLYPPPFSREVFVRELNLMGIYHLSADTLYELETDKNPPLLKSRLVVVDLISVLKKLNGLTELSQANELLELIEYEPLAPEECERISAVWVDESKKLEAEKIDPFAVLTPKAKTHIKEQHELRENHLSSGKIIGEAPAVPPIFLGRDTEMEELRKLLLRPNDGKIQVLTAMRGWPGVGKTTTAAALAHDSVLMDYYRDGILWISLGQYPVLLPKLSEWGRALGHFEIMAAQRVEEASALITSLLRDKRMLVIVDDVWSIKDMKPLLVGGRNCGMIVTTRQTTLANQITTRDQVYPLQGLSEEKSSELLAAIAPSVYEEFTPDCQELIRDLEGLPLAIRVAGNVLQAEKDSGLPVKKLFKEIKEGSLLLQSSVPGDQAELLEETPPSVASVLRTSVDHLSETARDCFIRLRVFAETPATFTRENAAYVWEEESPEPILKELIGHGLLEYVEASDRYQIHSLLVKLATTLAKVK